MPESTLCDSRTSTRPVPGDVFPCATSHHSLLPSAWLDSGSWRQGRLGNAVLAFQSLQCGKACWKEAGIGWAHLPCLSPPTLQPPSLTTPVMCSCSRSCSCWRNNPSPNRKLNHPVKGGNNHLSLVPSPFSNLLIILRDDMQTLTNGLAMAPIRKARQLERSPSKPLLLHWLDYGVSGVSVEGGGDSGDREGTRGSGEWSRSVPMCWAVPRRPTRPVLAQLQDQRKNPESAT